MDHDLLHTDHTYNHRDLERVVYQWLQVESDYLDKNLQRSSLHVVFVKRSMEYLDVVSHSIVQYAAWSGEAVAGSWHCGEWGSGG